MLVLVGSLPAAEAETGDYLSFEKQRHRQFHNVSQRSKGKENRKLVLFLM